MKFKAQMPKDEEKTYKLLPEGTYKFQVTDVVEATKKLPSGAKELVPNTLTVTCEVIEPSNQGENQFLRIVTSGDFLWLTKLFLKCIGEKYEGDVELDTDAWIGRQFWGEVKHKDGYANIKRMIYKNETQPVLNVGGASQISDPKDIAWND